MDEMQEDLQTIVSRADVALADRPGFLGCSVHTTAPPVLAFQFSTAVLAVQFQMMQSLAAPQFKYAIAPGRLDTVLEL